MTCTTVQAIARNKLLNADRPNENPCIPNTRRYPSSVGRSGIQRIGSVRIASDPLNDEDSIHRNGSSVTAAMISSIA